MCCCTEVPRRGHSTAHAVLPVLSRVKDHLPQPTGNNPPNTAHNTLRIHCHRYTLMVQHGVHQATQVLFCKDAFQLSGPQHVLLYGVASPQVKDLHFPLLNFIRIVSGHFSSLLRLLWMAA